jgi:hypothetical protein
LSAPLFPVAELVPAGARLDGLIAGNSKRDQPLRLTHALRVELAPVGAAPARLSVGSIVLGVDSWRRLGGATLRFSLEPRELEADGERIRVWDVDGALELGGDLHAVRISELRFGELGGLALPAQLVGRVEAHKLGYAPTPLSLSFTTQLGPVIVQGDLAHAEPPDRAQALEQAARFLALDDYEPRDEDPVCLYPRG